MRRRRGIRYIGLKVRKERQRQGLTQAQLANLAGLSRATISRIESGYSNLMLNTLARVVRALGGVLILRPVKSKEK